MKLLQLLSLLQLSHPEDSALQTLRLLNAQTSISVPERRSSVYKFTGPPLQASEFGWIFGEVKVARSKVRLRQDPSTNFWVIFKSAASMVPMRFAT